MSVHDVLVKARNLIADEKDWCGDGPIGPGGGKCAASAISVAHDRREDDALSLYRSACGAVLDAMGIAEPAPEFAPVTLGVFNDSHSHAEVLAAFNKAIAATAPEPDLSFLSDVTIRPEVEA